MKVIVYGTLKAGYGNNRLLSNSTFVSIYTVANYRLYDAGFPVAVPSEGESIRGELYDIGDDERVLASLDRLEGEGMMYNRVEVEPDTYMYVGHPDFWDFTRLHLCNTIGDDYVWGRYGSGHY